MANNTSLKDRMLSYEAVSDIRLTQNLPIIISLNGRGFRKLTSLFDKPYSDKFTEIMCKIMIRLASDISGASFLYCYNDIIVIVVQNKGSNAEAWCDNYIQKMVSIATSLASVLFQSFAKSLNIEIVGEPVFIGKTFILPSVIETINYIIEQQNQASNSALYMACLYELLKRHDVDQSLKILKELNVNERYDLLVNDYDVDLNSLPLSFWRGIGCYRAPKLVKSPAGEQVKSKLLVNDELPFFHKDATFLSNILNG